MAKVSANVVFLMGDYGHDPTETSVPYQAFKDAGFEVKFATENGKTPECDARMLRGVTQKLLGATSSVVQLYDTMAKTEEFKNPLSWTAPGFSLDQFELVFLPGGHEKGVRQVIDSEKVHTLLVDYFPKTKKPSKRVVGAVCHGVMVLSNSKDLQGHSVIRDCSTTALPTRFEQVAYHGTKLFLGDYYKTYGASSENVQESITKILKDPSQFKNSLSPSPFVVHDDSYNYVSARFPGDVELLSKDLVKLVKESVSVQ